MEHLSCLFSNWLPCKGFISNTAFVSSYLHFSIYTEDILSIERNVGQVGGFILSYSYFSYSTCQIHQILDFFIQCILYIARFVILIVVHGISSERMDTFIPVFRASFGTTFRKSAIMLGNISNLIWCTGSHIHH